MSPVPTLTLEPDSVPAGVIEAMYLKAFFPAVTEALVSVWVSLRRSHHDPR